MISANPNMYKNIWQNIIFCKKILWSVPPRVVLAQTHLRVPFNKTIITNKIFIMIISGTTASIGPFQNLFLFLSMLCTWFPNSYFNSNMFSCVWSLNLIRYLSIPMMFDRRLSFWVLGFPLFPDGQSSCAYLYYIF